MIGFFLFLGCSNTQKEPLATTVNLELIDEYKEGTTPRIQVENVQKKHLDIMISAYKELEAYHGSNLTKEVQEIRFVGKDFPWKPLTDKHYCIDTQAPESSGTEHIYYFANYCRSLSTLLRETNEILISYIDIQSCEDLCSCIEEKKITFRRKINCIEFCKPKGVELACESNKSLKKACCL